LAKVQNTLVTPRLILASSSKYRQELLTRLKIPFLSISPDVDETPFPGEPPEQLALRLALAKAQHIAQAYPKHVVIGADQVASLHDLPLGKPGHAAAAHAQLQQLSGQTVTFFSAMAVVLGSHVQSTVVPTHCVFRHLSEAAIARYIAIDQPFDTAGSAKAECLGIALMQSMHSSDPTSIIGLPLIELTKMLAQVGLDPLDEHIQ
jgi:septum formation protein